MDSEPVHWQCWNEILSPFGVSIDWGSYCKHCIGISDREMIAALCRQFDPALSFDKIWAQYPRKRELFRSRMTRPDAIDKTVTDLIAALRPAHLLAVVTSSGQREVEPILETSGLLPHLSAVVYGGDVQRLKPAPDPYLLAVERLGTRKALVVEDSAAGLAAGQAAGLDVLHIPTQAGMCSLVRETLGLER